MEYNRLRLLRLIDANLNRAVEGIRVLEDTARMVLDDAALTGTFKDLRHRVVSIVKSVPDLESELITARDVKSDVLCSGETDSEARRLDIGSIVKANSSRAQEAVRVLEEYSKLIAPGLSTSFKDIRFQLYDSERKLILKLPNAKGM